MSHWRTSSQSVSVLGSVDPNRQQQQQQQQQHGGADGLKREWKFPLQNGSVHHNNYEATTKRSYSVKIMDTHHHHHESGSAAVAEGGTFERTPIHRTRMSIAYSTVRRSSSMRKWTLNDYVQAVLFCLCLFVFVSALTGHGPRRPAHVVIPFDNSTMSTRTGGRLVDIDLKQAARNELKMRLDEMTSRSEQARFDPTRVTTEREQQDEQQHVLERVRIEDQQLTALRVNALEEDAKSPLDVLRDPTVVPVPKGNNNGDDALFSIDVDEILDQDPEPAGSRETTNVSDDDEADVEQEQSQQVQPDAAVDSEGALRVEQSQVSEDELEREQDQDRGRREWNEQLDAARQDILSADNDDEDGDAQRPEQDDVAAGRMVMIRRQRR